MTYNILHPRIQHQDFCFAFVVFEETNAVQKAIEVAVIFVCLKCVLLQFWSN